MRLKKVTYKLIKNNVGVFVSNSAKVDSELIFTISFYECTVPEHSHLMMGEGEYLGDKEKLGFGCSENLPDSVLTGEHSRYNDNLHNLLDDVMKKLWETLDDDYDEYVCEKCFQTGTILNYDTYNKKFIFKKCKCV